MIRGENSLAAIRRGIDFLRKRQLPDGEFQTIVAKDTALSIEPRYDASPFATAHIVSSLACCHLEECAPLIHRAASFLLRQSLTGGLWKFWSKNHAGFWNIPADMDDTSVVWLALRDAKITFSQNLGVLIGNVDEQGRFFTWIQRRRPHFKKPTSWWPLLASSSILGRNNFFQVGEACRDDIDAVVNANVIFRLAKHPTAIKKSIEWLWKIIASGEEDSADRYYQSRFALYYAICRGLRENVAGLLPFKMIIKNRLLDHAKGDGSIGQTAQDTALAISALVTVDGPREVIDRAVAFLLLQQLPDGSWPTSAYYYGGWSRDLCWGSQELTAGFCLEALLKAAK